MDLDKIAEQLKIKIIRIEEDYIPNTKSRGRARWNYDEKIGEIELSKKADDKTEAHEIGHIVNFIIGKGHKYSDKLNISSEDFADIIAEFLIVMAKGKFRK